MVNCCLQRMDRCKSHWLTSLGRILMLRTVISIIPLYSIIRMKIAMKVLKIIEQKMRIFFCNGARDEDKIPLLAWENICKPKNCGGVGLRNWYKMNEAMGAKLVWSIYNNPTQLWVQILREKYLDNMEDHKIFTILNPPRGSTI